MTQDDPTPAWIQHPEEFADWREEQANGETVLSFWSWLAVHR